MSREIIKEVRLVPTKNQSWKKKWRWDVVFQKPVDGLNPGVLDTRYHILRESGYTRTRVGAVYQISKLIGMEYVE